MTRVPVSTLVLSVLVAVLAAWGVVAGLWACGVLPAPGGHSAAPAVPGPTVAALPASVGPYGPAVPGDPMIGPVPIGYRVVEIDGKRVLAPEGSVVAFEDSRRKESVGGRVVETRSAEGVGAGLSATGDKIATEFQSQPSNATLSGERGGGASGGGFDLDASITGATGVPWTIWVAILLGAGAALLVYLRRFREAAIVGLLGGVVAAFSVAPALSAGAVVLAVAFYVYSEQKRRGAERDHLEDEAAFRKNREALRAVVAGIEDLPAEARRAAKRAIGSHAEESDKAVIRDVKVMDNLPSERAE